MRASLVIAVNLLGIGFPALACQAESRFSDTPLQVGRYSGYHNSPAFDQLNPLAQIVTVTFSPKRIRTVGQALQQLLLGSGYAQIHSPDEFARALLSKPLPDVHRQLGPLTLASALKTLIGQPYEIMVNEVRREVCVELKASIQPDAMTPLDQAILRPIPQSIPLLTADHSPAAIHRQPSQGHARY